MVDEHHQTGTHLGDSADSPSQRTSSSNEGCHDSGCDLFPTLSLALELRRDVPLGTECSRVFLQFSQLSSSSSAFLCFSTRDAMSRRLYAAVEGKYSGVPMSIPEAGSLRHSKHGWVCRKHQNGTVKIVLLAVVMLFLIVWKEEDQDKVHIADLNIGAPRPPQIAKPQRQKKRINLRNKIG
nr:hypothetical protein Iba_chr11bCG9910 [Ipomoea batatas]